MLLAIFSLFLWIAIFTFHATDPGFTHNNMTDGIQNYGGVFGAWLADVLLHLFGLIAYLLPLLLAVLTYAVIQERKQSQRSIFWLLMVLKIGGLLLILFAGCGLSHRHFTLENPNLLPDNSQPGGVFGDFVATQMVLPLLGELGSTLVLLALLLNGMTLLTGLSWFWLMETTGIYTVDLLRWIQRSVAVYAQRLHDHFIRWREAQELERRLADEAAAAAAAAAAEQAWSDSDSLPPMSALAERKEPDWPVADPTREVAAAAVVAMGSKMGALFTSAAAAAQGALQNGGAILRAIRAERFAAESLPPDPVRDDAAQRFYSSPHPLLDPNEPFNSSLEEVWQPIELKPVESNRVEDPTADQELAVTLPVSVVPQQESSSTSPQPVPTPAPRPLTAQELAEREAANRILRLGSLVSQATAAQLHAVSDTATPFRAESVVIPFIPRSQPEEQGEAVEVKPSAAPVELSHRDEVVVEPVVEPVAVSPWRVALDLDRVEQPIPPTLQPEELNTVDGLTVEEPDLELEPEIVPAVALEVAVESEWAQDPVAESDPNSSEPNDPDPQPAPTRSVAAYAPRTPPTQHRLSSEPTVERPSGYGLTEAGLPLLELLDDPPPSRQPIPVEELERISRLLEERLRDYKVQADVESVHPGPVVTRYEILPAPGVKVSQITNLSKDLARSLSTTSVRVVEVIPGKTTIGLEVPNIHRETVYLRETLSSEQYLQSKSPLTLALGKDISGNPIVADLAKMPHLLVAGTTGSGKSVAVNTMILSILYRATPKEVRMIMVDPKMLELSVYDEIPHLLAPVVTDMKDAANALRWCVAEMERRYNLMSKLKVRNIAGFNRKLQEAFEADDPIYDPIFVPDPNGFGPTEPLLLEPLPFIVVIVDELADMMMVVGKKVEELIARLAQKARAAGIHLILATQRPSVDVLTGLIKANIPTRIAFQVSSKVDSRTILDQMGAETLLGNGDMLYLPPGQSAPIRAHGAFVDDHEVNEVVEVLKTTGKPDYVEAIMNGYDEMDGEPLFPGDPMAAESIAGSERESDPLYDQAVQIVIESRRASVSGIQRRLQVGYNRAARMVEDMEVAGIVSPLKSNGQREVLAPPPAHH